MSFPWRPLADARAAEDYFEHKTAQTVFIIELQSAENDQITIMTDVGKRKTRPFKRHNVLNDGGFDNHYKMDG